MYDAVRRIRDQGKKIFLCLSHVYITTTWGTALAELCLLGNEATDTIWVKMAIAHNRFNCHKQNHLNSVQ